jgi:hypothetical protein
VRLQKWFDVDTKRTGLVFVDVRQSAHKFKLEELPEPPNQCSRLQAMRDDIGHPIQMPLLKIGRLHGLPTNLTNAAVSLKKIC